MFWCVKKKLVSFANITRSNIFKVFFKSLTRKKIGVVRRIENSELCNIITDSL